MIRNIDIQNSVEKTFHDFPPQQGLFLIKMGQLKERLCKSQLHLQD